MSLGPTGRGAAGPGGARALTGLVVFASAFLLFVLELAAAKALLPRFGGTPMVWTASMLAYQVLLLAGYAYAHGLAGARSVRRQAVCHAVLLAVAVCVCGWRLRAEVFAAGEAAAAARAPLGALLVTLLGTVALPFVAVSATSPLVQHWQSRLAGGRPAYWLYGVSNVGSFAGLLAYPAVIEPLVGLARQFVLWTLLFGGVALGLAAVALRACRAGGPAPAVEPEAVSRRARCGGWAAWGERLPWVALPACTSALLLAATNELCQDLAVFPFLWVVPLALYLLSFTLAFRTRPLRNLMPEAAVATVAALSTSAASLMLPAPVHVVAIGALVFALCAAAHRELYRLRPDAGGLTGYYLWIAAGSGLGAVAVTVAAPLLFRGFWEFQLAVLVLWAVLIGVVAADRGGALRTGDVRQAAALAALLAYMVLNQIPEAWLRRWIGFWPESGGVSLRLAAAALVAAGVVGLARRERRLGWPLWPRVLAGLVLFVAECALVQRVRGDLAESGFSARNFFGTVRVREVVHAGTGVHIRQLTHGRINHGWQYLNEGLRGEPTAYHSRSTGIGLLVRAQQRGGAPLRIGVTGLGAGALAAYPRAGDSIVFYEIDPQVVALAAGGGAVFGFLNGCAGACEVVLGDARQSLLAERARLGSRAYDVLALDAFTSDAVPMHLLTREAFELYLSHLRPAGVLAVNISNRFLDLEPVLAGHAAQLGLSAVLVDSLGDPPVRARSLWVLLSRDAAALEAPELRRASRALAPLRVTWTDQACSPFRLLKWWSPRSRQLRVVPRRNQQDEGITGPALTPAQTPGPPGA